MISCLSENKLNTSAYNANTRNIVLIAYVEIK